MTTTPETLLQRDYCCEAITDIEQDIYESFQDVETDEHGMMPGTIRVTVEYIPLGDED